MLSDHKTVTVFVKRFLRQKHVVLQLAAPLQLKCFKVGSKMAIAASAPVLPNQKIQCRKIARFTDAPCTYKIEVRLYNQCCSGKAMIITYSACVFVTLGIHYAARVRHTVICGLTYRIVFFHPMS
jgi:hypothetical protein